MAVFALTGGIAAGKSTVAGYFRALGAHTVDADQLARIVLAPGSPELETVVAIFGSHLLDTRGLLKRQQLAEIIFADPKQRQQLEKIVHPAVQRLAEREFSWKHNDDPTAVIIYEVPLLVEADIAAKFQGNIVLAADPKVRLKRLVSARGMNEKAAAERIAAQVDEQTRLAFADWVIRTDVTEAETQKQVKNVYVELKKHAQSSLD